MSRQTNTSTIKLPITKKSASARLATRQQQATASAAAAPAAPAPADQPGVFRAVGDWEKNFNWAWNSPHRAFVYRAEMLLPGTQSVRSTAFFLDHRVVVAACGWEVMLNQCRVTLISVSHDSTFYKQAHQNHQVFLQSMKRKKESEKQSSEEGQSTTSTTSTSASTAAAAATAPGGVAGDAEDANDKDDTVDHSGVGSSGEAARVVLSLAGRGST